MFADGSISELVDAGRSIAERTTLILVANTRSAPTKESDYEETSVTTEYFTSAELTALLKGFRSNGFYVEYVGSELEFIKADLSGGFPRSGRPMQVVYNTAQSGTGAGRKALVPAYCARRKLNICNSDSYVVSLVRQKFHVHCILKRVGLPTTDSWYYSPPIGWIGARPSLQQKVIAKAAFESSSIGLTEECIGFPDDEYEAMLLKKCEIYRQPFVVQTFIEGYEVEVPVLESGTMRAVDVISVALDDRVELGNRVLFNDIIDEERYGYASSDHLSLELRFQMMRAAEAAANSLGIRGIGRVDFRIDFDGNARITDVSTSPHLVPHGSIARSFAWNGHSHADMLAAMVGANVKRWDSPLGFRPNRYVGK